MPKLNQLMSLRSIRKLDEELTECKENLNTWFTIYKKLYSMKRSLNKKCLSQNDRAIQLVAKSFTTHYYTGDMLYSESDSDSDLDSNDKARRKSNNKVNNKTDDNMEIDIDVDVDSSESDSDSDVDENVDENADENSKLNMNEDVVEVKAKSKAKSKAKAKSKVNTKFQEDALKVLSNQEDEQTRMDKHIAERRRQLYEQTQKADSTGPLQKKDIKFTLNVVDQEEPNTVSTSEVATNAVPDNKKDTVEDTTKDTVEDTDEILLEEEIIETVDGTCSTSAVVNSERVLSDSEIAELATKCIENGMMGIPLNTSGTTNTNGTTNTTNTNGTTNTTNTAGTSDTSKPYGVKFITDLGPPPEVTPLLKISPSQRELLYQKLFLTAKDNVLNQLGDNKLDQEKIYELTRKETDRLLQVYKETH